jgi:very-short-patch-repair endonuclease
MPVVDGETVEERVCRLLAISPNLKAKEIAEKLGGDRHEINNILYGKLQGKVRRDRSFRWSLVPAGDIGKHTEKVTQTTPDVQTPLTRLCRYYLDCISYEEQGVSTFARNQYGNPDYLELPSLPMFSGAQENPLDAPPAKSFIQSARRPGSQKTLYLGYPVRLRFFRSKKGWEGYFVEPIFLFTFDLKQGVHGSAPALNEDLPFLNFEALKHLTGGDQSSLMHEAVALSNELGLNNPAEDLPEMDELFTSLRTTRSEWDWIDDTDPYALSMEPPLSQLEKQGIYNRAILITGERSQYTQGLEVELGKLSALSEDDIRKTALGQWINQTLGVVSRESVVADSRDDTSLEDDELGKYRQTPLLEVVPMNTEQREAVRKALSDPLTVITGPPGTGKSQVVTNLLVNCAWRGQKVLFASKNNKAVDVVEERTNGLGSRPVLMRLGAKELQAKLAQYLLDLLAAKASPDDQTEFEELREAHNKLAARFEELEAEYNRALDARNTVDRLEKDVCGYREEFGPGVFSSIREMRLAATRSLADVFQRSLKASQRELQFTLIRIIWPLIVKGRYEALAAAARDLGGVARTLGMQIPRSSPDEMSIREWIEFGVNLERRLAAAQKIKKYFEALDSLKKLPPFEELARRQMKLIDRISDNSLRLWQFWIRLQPNRIPPHARALINNQAAILQMVIQSRMDDGALPPSVSHKYYGLVSKLAEILPCWAVTSLSANKRIPFEPAFFDLLVIDESSQCDIASALPLLFRAKRVVIIGDPNQLKHISSISPTIDGQLQQRHDIVKDFAAWLYSVNSLFNLASGLCRSEDIIQLKDHHRSHANIITFSNKYFYREYLRIATRYDKLRQPAGESNGIRWTEVSGDVVRPPSGGAVNEKEARALVREVEDLVLQRGYQGTVGVVTPFRNHANRIREIAHSNDSLMRALSNSEFLVDVVHKFQGDERDVMFFSPVVSGEMPGGATWFLKSQGNLFNVAITRARALLHVVGDHKAALRSDVEYLQKFAAYVEEIRRGAAEQEEDFRQDYGPVYPTVANPQCVSDWERIFYKALYSAGIRPIPQYPVEQYLLDFAVIDGQRRLNIEVDGERYHRAWNGELCRKDQIRNQRLIELGWDVKRFWVYEIRDEMDACVQYVADWEKGNPA